MSTSLTLVRRASGSSASQVAVTGRKYGKDTLFFLEWIFLDQAFFQSLFSPFHLPPSPPLAFPPFSLPFHVPFSLTHSLFIGCLELFTLLSPYSVIGKFKIQLDSFSLLLVVSLNIADMNYLLDEGCGYFSISGSHLFSWSFLPYTLGSLFSLMFAFLYPWTVWSLLGSNVQSGFFILLVALQFGDFIFAFLILFRLIL